jgi:hypothetical protein
VSQPKPYTPAHAFVSDSATLANFPGQALDVEFAAIENVIGDIEGNLALLQRDDGALANGSVTYDSLSASLQTAGMAPATPWGTGTRYAVGNNVFQNENLYRCLIAHTSGVFATDLANGNWLFVTGLGNFNGSGTSVVGNLPKYTDTTGRNVTDSGVAVASLAPLVSPAFTTPSLGVATATSINGNTLTSGTYTLTGAAGKTFTFSNSLTLTGTDGTVMTFPGTSDTVATLAAVQTLTNKTLTGPTINGGSGAFTTALNLTVNQNTSTSISSINTTAGTGSLANFFANSDTAIANFGAASSLYATQAVLANRGYIYTTAASSGIALDASGSNPIVFATNDIERGRFAAGGAFNLGVAGAFVGSLVFNNATSGSITVNPATGALGAAIATLPAGTYNLVGDSLVQALTNKTFDTAGAGNVFKINGTAISANTGTGSNVLATSPTLVTPALGAATATSINGASIDNLAWTAYAPTVAPQAGSFTGATVVASGRYKQIGKTVFLETDVLLTALGSGSPAGGLTISLPLTAAAFNYAGNSTEIAVTGKSGRAIVISGGTTLDARDSTGTTYIATGAHVVCAATYEVP